MANVEHDHVSGHDTTGHEWDGIKELNTPLPSWWVWVFFVCIIWAIGYWVLYPAWPTANTATSGVLGWHSRTALDGELTEAKEEQAPWMNKIQAASVGQIEKDPDLLNFAMAGGRVAFGDNCAPCHGSGGVGNPGFPRLVDNAWIWGGSLDQIKATITNGVRNENPASHGYGGAAAMPAFGPDMLPAADLKPLAEYVASLSMGGEAPEKGKETYTNMGCGACHGDQGQGHGIPGAPALNDKAWVNLKGVPTREEVVQLVEHQVRQPNMGVMPDWGKIFTERLGKEEADATIKLLTVYVHSLGGGN